MLAMIPRFNIATKKNCLKMHFKLRRNVTIKMFILLNCLNCLNGSTESTMLGFDVYHQNTLPAPHVSGNSIKFKTFPL